MEELKFVGVVTVVDELGVVDGSITVGTDVTPEVVIMTEAEFITDGDTTAVGVLDVLGVVIGVDAATDTDVAGAIVRVAEAVV